MYSDVKDNIIDYKKMHSLGLNNSVGMSIFQSVKPSPSKKN